MLYDESEKASLSLVTNFSDDSSCSKVTRLKCKFCERVASGRTDLQSHVLESHRAEVQQQLVRPQKSSEDQCPSCSFSSGDEDQMLSHFAASHCDESPTLVDGSVDSDGNESDVTDRSTSTPVKNGPKTSPTNHRRLGRKGDHDKPRNFAEFSRQVEQNLRTENGKFAVAVDERSIRCVCGKVVRTCGKFYWKYLVQRPTIKNGQVIQKGHWFTCAAVAEFKSCIDPWPVSQEEIEASKLEASSLRRNGVDSGNGGDDVDAADTRRGARKRLQVDRDVEQSASKRLREDDSDDEVSDDDDDMTDDEIDPEISETQARFRVKKLVMDKLAQRVPGDVFLQDGPCFQVS